MQTLWGNGYDALLEFDDLRRRMDQIIRAGLPGGRLGASGAPRISMLDDGAALRVWAELPGVDADDLKIDIAQRDVTISGTRKVEVPNGYTAHRRERGSIDFRQSFALPCRVDLEKTTATLDNGVLRVELPKVPEEQPRSITINVS